MGATLEAGLVPLIIADVQEQPGTLPLMQYALTELFEQRQGRLLTIEAYQTSGGVMGALARRADELYTDLNDTGRATTRRLFMRLVTLGEGVEDTRRRVLRSELDAFGGDEDQRNSQFRNPKSKIENVIDTFGQYRLLTFDRDPVTRGPTVEVAHEALIREWDRLRQWLDQDREFLFWQQRLRAGLHQWQTSDHDEGALLRGAPLAEAENWLNQRRADLNETEREFIQASLALRERQAAEREAQLRRELEWPRNWPILKNDAPKIRRKPPPASVNGPSGWLAGVGIVAVLLAIAAGVFGVQSSQNAEQAVLAEQTAEARRQQAEDAQAESEASRVKAEQEARRARASQLASQAQIVLENGEDPSGTLPLLLAREAVLTTLTEDGYFTPEADAALRQVVDTVPVLLKTFSGHTNGVVVADFSPDGKTLATGSLDQTVRLWDVETGRKLHRLKGHKLEPWSIDFSPDGKTLVSASPDRTVRLWDVATGAEIRRFEGHTGAVVWAVFSPDGRTIATAGDSTSRSGSVTTAQLQDGTGSVSYDKTIRLWDVATGAEVRRFEIDVAVVAGLKGRGYGAFSPDGRSIIITSASPDNTARLWAARPKGDTRHLRGHLNPVKAVDFSPGTPQGTGGQTIVTAGDDKIIRLWDAVTGEEIARLEGHTGRVNAVVFSPDGQMLASAGFDKTIRLWDLETKQEINRFEGHMGTILSLVFSPDGQTIATAAEDKTARLRDVNTGQEIRQFVGHTSSVNAVAFRSDPDGQTIVTGGADKAVLVWNVQTGEEVRRLEGHTLSILAVDFSPDGQTLVSAGTDNTVRLWDADLGREIGQLEGHKASVNAAVFSPDGQTIVTTSDDGSVPVWDVETHSVTRRLDGHTDKVLSAAFSPDGQTIVTASADKTARIWPSVEQLLAEAESLIQRDPPEFIPEERTRFGLATE